LSYCIGHCLIRVMIAVLPQSQMKNSQYFSTNYNLSFQIFYECPWSVYGSYISTMLIVFIMNRH
jgi:hypothetical protein